MVVQNAAKLTLSGGFPSAGQFRHVNKISIRFSPVAAEVSRTFEGGEVKFISNHSRYFYRVDLQLQIL